MEATAVHDRKRYTQVHQAGWRKLESRCLHVGQNSILFYLFIKIRKPQLSMPGDFWGWGRNDKILDPQQLLLTR